MPRNVAIIGAGVSGLTCGIAFAEQGYRVSIFAEEIDGPASDAVTLGTALANRLLETGGEEILKCLG